MATTDSRRPSLLLPFFLPDFHKEDRLIKSYVSAFVDVLMSLVFAMKSRLPTMMVELSLFPQHGIDRQVLEVFQTQLKKNPGLVSNLRLVLYPFGQSLASPDVGINGPLRFMLSLPKYVALPCNPFASRADVSKCFSRVKCSFSALYAELLCNEFYSQRSDEKQRHPFILQQESALLTDLKALSSTKEHCLGRTDVLRTASYKGGHRAQKFFLVPFTWVFDDKERKNAAELKELLHEVLETILQRFIALVEEE